MDLSDLLPLLIIIGGALLSFVGKAAKGAPKEDVPSQRRAVEEWPPSLPDEKQTHLPDDADWDDWIPRNEPRELPEVPCRQPWESEGQRAINDEEESAALRQSATTRQSAEADANYAPADDTEVAPEDWRKAIIAYEILKTKF